MKKEIKYSTSEQQPEKLLSQHLIINNRKHSLIGLKLFGYSSLIKSYCDPYILKINNTVYYRDGISFEQISSLYFLIKPFEILSLSCLPSGYYIPWPNSQH